MQFIWFTKYFRICHFMQVKKKLYFRDLKCILLWARQLKSGRLNALPHCPPGCAVGLPALGWILVLVACYHHFSFIHTYTSFLSSSGAGTNRLIWCCFTKGISVTNCMVIKKPPFLKCDLSIFRSPKLSFPWHFQLSREDAQFCLYIYNCLWLIFGAFISIYI